MVEKLKNRIDSCQGKRKKNNVKKISQDSEKMEITNGTLVQDSARAIIAVEKPSSPSITNGHHHESLDNNISGIRDIVLSPTQNSNQFSSSIPSSQSVRSPKEISNDPPIIGLDSVVIGNPMSNAIANLNEGQRNGDHHGNIDRPGIHNIQPSIVIEDQISEGADGGYSGQGYHPGSTQSYPTSHLQSPRQHIETLEEKDLEQVKQIRVEEARMISMVSIVFCALFAFVAFLVGVIDTSVALIGLSFEFFLDALTSVLVLWRFKIGKVRNFDNVEAANNFEARRTARRERQSGIGIGCVFILTALFLIIGGIWKLNSWDDGSSEHKRENRMTSAMSEILAWPAGFLFGYLGKRKLKLAKQLDSGVLLEDAVCSLLAAAMCGVVIFAGFLERGEVHGAWKADPIAGIIIAVILGVEGVRTLKDHLYHKEEMRHQIMYEL